MREEREQNLTVEEKMAQSVKEGQEAQWEQEQYEREQERRRRIEAEEYYNEGERHNFGR